MNPQYTKLAIKLHHLSLILILALIVSSCSTTRNLPVKEVKPLAASKVMRKMERAAPNYNIYESKKIAVEFNVNNEKNSVSGQFKLKKDKCIILSVRKLSLPIGKGLLSPDSIVFINYFDKSYLTGTFNDVKKLIGVDITYNLLQALLTADISNFVENENVGKEFSSSLDNQMYRLDGQFDAKKTHSQTSESESLTSYKLSFWIDPFDFIVRKISLRNDENNENIVINYNKFESIGRNKFPQEVIFEYLTPQQKALIEVNLSKSSVNSDNDFSFSVPEKFEKMKLKGM